MTTSTCPAARWDGDPAAYSPALSPNRSTTSSLTSREWIASSTSCARGIFGHWNIAADQGGDGCAAGLTQLERGVRIARQENLFHGGLCRLVEADDFANTVIDDAQTARDVGRVAHTDTAAVDIAVAAAGLLYDAVARDP